MLTPKQQARIKILSAIEKVKKSGKRYTKTKREYVDITSKHLPTKRNFQESIVNYINKKK
jgi:hypothetical protein